MWRLNEIQELWGYRPLTLFLAAWGAILLGRIWWRRVGGKRVRWSSLQRATATGVLLGVGFPDLLPFPVLLFIAWIPLLLFEKEMTEQKKSYWIVFRYGFHSFILWNIIATYWVANTAIFAGLFAIVANSLLMSIPWMLFHFVHRHAPKVAYPALIALWFCFDNMHLHWDLTWPWLMLGNGFAEWPWAVQWYEWTGVFGGSLWVWIVNLLFLAYITSPKQQAGRARSLYLGIGLIIAPMIFSFIRYNSYNSEGDTIDVAVVQPNFEPHYVKFDLPQSQQLEVFTRLSLDVIDAETDYLVFPESSFSTVEETTVGRNRYLRGLTAALQDYPELLVVTGINGYVNFGKNPGPSDNLRVTRDSSFFYEATNSAIQFPIKDLSQVQVHRKGKLVPGPEIFPFKDLFWFMEPLIEQLDGTTAGLATNPNGKVKIMSSDKAVIGPAICYESVFGQYFTDYVKQGAQAIFIMTNDGWWSNTAGHRQHLYFASLRAIETRRSIARSANTGISAFINQRGDIRMATNYDEPATIRDKIKLNDHQTFYAHNGDLLARLALFLSAIFLLNALVKKITTKATEEEEEE